MAEGIKISEMTEVETLNDEDVFAVVVNGENKKITKENLRLSLLGSIFPVGSKYISSVNPSTFLGGTWSSQPLVSEYQYYNVQSLIYSYGNVKLNNRAGDKVYEWTRTA